MQDLVRYLAISLVLPLVFAGSIAAQDDDRRVPELTRARSKASMLCSRPILRPPSADPPRPAQTSSPSLAAKPVLFPVPGGRA